MTLLLAHPAEEDLGRFVEGTLPDSDRGEVVAHIADCDECRILVVDSAEFIEPAKKESTKWWITIAAALILSAGIGGFGYRHFHDPLADLKGTYGQLKARPQEARLDGFPYKPLPGTRGNEEGTDPAKFVLDEAAAAVARQEGSEAKILHARGVAHLFTRNLDLAVAELTAAANADQRNAGYWSDVSAAQLEANDPAAALLAANHALALSSRQHAAQFNRALALEKLGQRDNARRTYREYVSADPTSAWAAEAQRKLSLNRRLQVR